jgi:protein SCO1/2
VEDRLMPILILLLWIGATLGWWAFAFMPLPARPPEWLEAARFVCFGSMESGWPEPSGWILLVVAPATLLAGIVALWRDDLAAAARRLARRPAAQALVAMLALVVVVEAGWVAAKLRTARRIATADVAAAPAALPADYPRLTATAPDFTLIDQHGDTISLGRFRGRPLVLTFVFAHCRTMCPTLVETVKRASAGARPSEALLVTLDPWRDTVGTLPAIARQWNVPDGVHVLSGRRVEDVLAVVRAYEVPFERDEKTGDVTHPGLVFVIDGDGRLAFTFNNPPVAWVRDALDRLAGLDRNLG